MYLQAFILLVIVFAVTAGSAREDASVARETNNKERTLKISSVPIHGPAQTKNVVKKNTQNKTALLPPEITAEIASVVMVDDDKTLFELQSAYRHPIASITKLVTAIAAKKLLKGDARITMQEEDIAAEGPAGDFAIGEIYSVDDLIKAMLIVSSNDAAVALARTAGTKTLIDTMQQMAREFGMDNTAFFDETGLSSLNQSTAVDLAKLIDGLSKNHTDLLRTTRAIEATITDERSREFRVLKNINEFAGLPEFEGGKTGYTEEARGNLVSLFRTGEHKLFIVVLGSHDRFGDTRKLYDWAKEVLQ